MPLVDVEPPVTDTSPFYTKTAGAEPIPSYRLIEPLGRGGFGEVWKCEAPGGLPKAIKFVLGDEGSILGTGGAAKQELQALEHCKTIRHPFILSMERVELIDNELVIVMELADRSLYDLRVDYRASGHPGIPRPELLGYLREAAEVLDFLFHEHRLQHLDIKPHNLFLVSTHIKVADFGLVSSLAERHAKAAACGTPLYSAPEVFNGRISQHSDQYSLAVTYQELLTGTLPFQGKNARQLMQQHATAEPNLEALPARDRALVAKAMAKDPGQRFPSCLELIHSLMYEKIVLSSVTAVPAGLTDPAATPAQGFLDETLPDADAPRPAAAASLAACDMIPGYELVKCVSRHLLSDLWQVLGPEGREQQAQLLHAPPYRGAVVVDKLQALRHPALPRYEILRSPAGRIFLVGDAPLPTLNERYAACRQEGQPGIPRAELLGYLTEVAAALDELQREHRFGHLALHPRHIVLRPERVLVAQFGMVALLWPLQVKPAGALAGRYAAPELSVPGCSASSDQYSLALIYAEMLMGVQPRQGRGGGRGQGKLDLDLLPACDRAPLAQALSADPAQRFASSSEFIRVLVESPQAAAAGPSRADWTDVAFRAALTGAGAPTGLPRPTVEQLVADWLCAATAAVEFRQLGNLRCLFYANGVIEHRYPVRVIPGALRMKLHDLPKRWNAQQVCRKENLLVCRMAAAPTFWQRCFGGESGLEVQISVEANHDPNPQLVQALVRIEPYGAPANRSPAPGIELGPELIANVRSYLEEDLDRRRCERWPCPLDLHVYPVLADGAVGERLDATAKNISNLGIGFHVAEPLEAKRVYVAASTSAHALLVQVLHSAPNPAGGFDIGGRFGQAEAEAS